MMNSRFRHRHLHRHSFSGHRLLRFSKTSQISKLRNVPRKSRIFSPPVPKTFSLHPNRHLSRRLRHRFTAAGHPRPGPSLPRPRPLRPDGSSLSSSNNRNRRTSHSLKRNSHSNRCPNPLPLGLISFLKILSCAAAINLILVM